MVPISSSYSRQSASLLLSSFSMREKKTSWMLTVIGQFSSPDPVAPKAGHRSDAASFLNYHVDVGFHYFGDLSNLKQATV